MDRLFAGDPGGAPVDVVASARGLPMLGDRRIVIVLRAERWLKPKRSSKSSEAADETEGADGDESEDAAADMGAIEDYLAAPSPSTTLVLVATAVEALAGSGIPVAAVSTGFPAGLSPLRTRIDEVKASVAAGAKEIDIVITRGHVLTGNWHALHDEVRAFRDAAGDAHMKAILGTGDLATLTNVARAAMVAMMAGADFIKTSTGKEGVNATLPISLVMVRMIREYFEQTGFAIGYKPAGGIRSAKNSLEYLYLMKEELGDRWLRADLFRIGASGLLTDIERQLEHFATGRYAAAHRQPMV